jgi:hypothetical protein
MFNGATFTSICMCVYIYIFGGKGERKISLTLNNAAKKICKVELLL